MAKRRPFPLLFLVHFILLSFQSVFAQNQVPFNVISSGGDKLTGAGVTLTSTVGEAFTGISQNATNNHYSGFWYVYRQSTLTGVDDETIPKTYRLEQNYPNPFNPATVIKYGVPERCMVLIKIYDVLGNEILTLVNGEMEAGWYETNFSAARFSSGVYIYRMQAGSYQNTKKMILVK